MQNRNYYYKKWYFRKSAFNKLPAKHKTKCGHQPEALSPNNNLKILWYFSQWPITKAGKSRSEICFGEKYPRTEWAVTKKPIK